MWLEDEAVADFDVFVYGANHQNEAVPDKSLDFIKSWLSLLKLGKILTVNFIN